MGDLNPIYHDSLDLSEPTTQMTSQLVLQFFTDDCRMSLYFTMGHPFPPQNCPFHGGSGPPSNTWFLGPPKSLVIISVQHWRYSARCRCRQERMIQVSSQIKPGHQLTTDSHSTGTMLRMSFTHTFAHLYHLQQITLHRCLFHFIDHFNGPRRAISWLCVCRRMYRCRMKTFKRNDF